MSKLMINKQKGFSLVEIAIVLVIIGLLLGGVLKGQEMIRQAKIKAQIQQINGVVVAINTYIDRYSYNDFKDKVTKNTDIIALSNGGYLSTGSRTNSLKNKYGFLTNIYYSTGTTKATGASYRVFASPGFIVCSRLPQDIAEEIDRKLDDGDHTSGSYRSSDGNPYGSVASKGITCTSVGQ